MGKGWAMDEMEMRSEELRKLFFNVDESERKFIDKLIEEVSFLEFQMRRLRKMPFIVRHPRNPDLMKSTPAAKQYKECSQSYMNAIRILLTTLRKTDTSAQDELLKKLEEFM